MGFTPPHSSYGTAPLLVYVKAKAKAKSKLAGRFFVLTGAIATLLVSACDDTVKVPRTADKGPTSQELPGPSRKELIEEINKLPIPDLSDGKQVAKFVDWAGAAPVSRREEVREQVHKAQGNATVAKSLIEEFQKSEHVDHSRALVILSLLGELRNPVGTAFLREYVWRPLPKDGPIMAESGQSLESENMERLQVQAVNGLAYTKVPEALSEVLKVVAEHPSKAVRTEAVSSYLWNSKNSVSARQTLLRYLRQDEVALLDRPVRGVDMSANEFNHQIELFLESHPELKPPEPTHAQPSESGPAKDTGPRNVATPPPL